MRSPHNRTALPGPKAQALLTRDRAVTTPSYPRDYPFVMAKGRGVEVWDVDGNRYLDFMSGIGVCSTGHAHPQVVQAIKDAADDFLHISSDYWHERMTQVGEKINALNPLHAPVQGLARLHREQVSPAGRVLPDHAGRHARAVPKFVPAAVRRR